MMTCSRAVLILLAVVARTAGAQLPVLTDTTRVRVTRREFCWDVSQLFRCSKWPVYGTVLRATPDTVSVRLDHRRTGILAHVTTGTYPDSVFVWDSESRGVRVEALVGHRTRAGQVATHAALGAAAGLLVGTVGNSVCLGTCTAQDERNLRLTGLAIGAGLGAAVGLVRSTAKWRVIRRGRFQVSPLVGATPQGGALGIRVTQRALSN